MNIERRKKPRIKDPLQVSVSGSSDQGRPYQFDTISLDFGSGGLCAISPQIIHEREEISLHIRLALAGSNPSQAPEVAAHAIVLRSQARPDGTCLFAASFLNRHVL